jgi:hypothetical protein
MCVSQYSVSDVKVTQSAGVVRVTLDDWNNHQKEIARLRQRLDNQEEEQQRREYAWNMERDRLNAVIAKMQEDIAQLTRWQARFDNNAQMMQKMDEKLDKLLTR